MSRYQATAVDNIVCLYDPKNERKTNGLLVYPPKLMVVWYDEELDQMMAERISYKVAEVLAPETMKRISGIRWGYEALNKETEILQCSTITHPAKAEESP